MDEEESCNTLGDTELIEERDGGEEDEDEGSERE